MDKDLFAKRFKEYRRKARLTQQEVADKLEISPNFIRQLEAGDKLPSLETFERISLIFGVPSDCLLQDLDEEHCVFAIAGLIEKLRTKNHEQLQTIIEILETINDRADQSK